MDMEIATVWASDSDPLADIRRAVEKAMEMGVPPPLPTPPLYVCSWRAFVAWSRRAGGGWERTRRAERHGVRLSMKHPRTFFRGSGPWGAFEFQVFVDARAPRDGRPVFWLPARFSLPKKASRK